MKIRANFVRLTSLEGMTLGTTRFEKRSTFAGVTFTSLETSNPVISSEPTRFVRHSDRKILVKVRTRRELA
jgi:hypothetical protein